MCEATASNKVGFPQLHLAQNEGNKSLTIASQWINGMLTVLKCFW